ncbi:DegT/DnrJ/EryC1/StrS family aminotransferase [Streptomyces sp. INA 01156]
MALRHWCPPGGRVLMSPVNDDVIFFVVLAAGLRPVQAPLNPLDASIDTDAVPEEVWGSLSAVLTTNLYGNPDPAPELRSRCDALGIPLFEDGRTRSAARSAGGRSAPGRRVCFSLSKHVGAQTGASRWPTRPERSGAGGLRRTARPAPDGVRTHLRGTAVRRGRGAGLGLRRAAWAAMGRLG